MAFNVLTIRTGDDVDDGALYPVLSEPSQPGLLLMDSHDGPNVQSFVATGVRVLQVAETLKVLIKLREVRIDIAITDARVAIACEKYDKGGGWVGFGAGGVLFAATANAVSKARAANRRRGKVLVGQVRYPWVTAVGATSKSGFGTDEAIRIEFREKAGGATVRKLLELTLPRNIDATRVAQDIARRVGSYRLSSDRELSPAEEAAFTTLSQGPELLRPAPRAFAYYRTPTSFYVSARTAFPHKDGKGEPGSGAAAAAHVASPQVAADANGIDAEGGPGPAAAGGPAPIFCTKCGTRNVVGNAYCKQCGSPLASTQGLPANL